MPLYYISIHYKEYLRNVSLQKAGNPNVKAQRPFSRKRPGENPADLSHKKEEIISFSANVNPLGISSKLRNSLSRHLDAITVYPDREYKELRQCIAQYAGSQPENIIVGNGSTELISLFIQTYHPKKAIILGPTYSEYEREITLGGGSTVYYPLREELGFQMDVQDFCSHLNDSLDLAVLCNPNNPTSTAISASEMRQILDACLQHGIFVMVDETYVEFSEQVDAVSSVSLTNYYTNLIILRALQISSRLRACGWDTRLPATRI